MNPLRIAIAQLNFTIGDIGGNIARMQTAAQQARQQGAQMVVFSELSLTAYYPGDLLRDKYFRQQVATGLQKVHALSRETPGLYWVLGAPVAHQGPGKPLHNALLVIHDGELLLSYAKQLLPTYNVFDERRHFEPGPDVGRVLRIGETRVGFLICEDGWNDGGNDYSVNPLLRLVDAAPDLIISIHASPSEIGKREQRHALFTRASKHHDIPMIYVNQVGGHDQLVFDGASFVVTPDEGVVYEAQRFTECIDTLVYQERRILRVDLSACRPVSIPGMSPQAFYQSQIQLGLRDYMRRCGFKKVLVGCSGGIDSALTLALAVGALGAENVVAVTMPSEYSSSGSVDDSRILCEHLGVRLYQHPINTLLAEYRQGFTGNFDVPLSGVALENLQARIRGIILMSFSNQFGHLLLTTGNKSEIAVGYCTLYGDTNGGLNLIGDLYKTEVFALSRHLNEQAGYDLIPETIIVKPPSAELAPGQRDEDSLPPYEVLDMVLKYLIEGDLLTGTEQVEVAEAFDRLALTPSGGELIARIKNLMARSEYKRRQAPPILRLHRRAFGNGRQLPVAACYDYC